MQKLDMVSYHCSMPVLENVHVSLNEILEVRGKPLKESELWAILYQTAQALQNIFLKGHACNDGFPQFLVTPDNLLCCATGRVILNVCHRDKIRNSQFWCNEIDTKDFLSQKDNLEKVYVFTLGQTLLTAANFSVTPKNQKTLSPLIKAVFQSLCQPDFELRMSLSDIIEVCSLHAKKYMDGSSFSNVIVKLHCEILGSLPEEEILTQVDRDIAKENENNDIKNTSKDPLEADYSLNYLSYGHRLGYHPEISLSVCPSSAKSHLTVKERWQKAFYIVRNQIRNSKLCSSSKDEVFKKWENSKAHDSILKVYEELSERRRMLELLRLSINIEPAAQVEMNKNILTAGLKPKTIAELVLLLQKPDRQHTLTKPNFDVHNNNELSTDTDSELPSSNNVASVSSKPYQRRNYYNIQELVLKAPFSIDSNRTQQLIGPEYVLYQLKPHERLSPFCNDKELLRFAFIVSIKLLTGETIEVECIPSTTAKQLYQFIADKLNLQERYLFGLVYDHDGEDIFLEKRQRIRDMFNCYSTNSSIISDNMIQLFLKVKFYLSDVHLMRTLKLQHYFYLQLRKDFIEDRFYCHKDLAITLSSLALQAEFGDYDISVYGKEYFLLEHYLPLSCINQFNRIDAKTKLCDQHSHLRGVSRQLAEVKFMQAYMKLPEYGSHFYKVYQDKRNLSSAVWLGIKPSGIEVYDNISKKRSVSQVYSWFNIKRISYSKKYFSIAPNNENLFGKRVVYKFYTMGLSRSQYLFSISIAHHKFHRKLNSLSGTFDLFSEDLEEEHSYNCSKADVGNEFGCYLHDGSEKFHPHHETRTRRNSENDIELINTVPTRKIFPKPPHSEYFPKASAKLVVRSSSAPNPEKKKKIEYFWKSNSTKELRPGAPHTIPKNSCGKHSMKLVRLQRDSNCGFGMVITCGNTYDTILHGAFVESVYPGSPADKNGNISPGDQIMFVNGTDVQNDDFLTVVDLLQHSNSSVELIIAKSNSNSSISNIIEKEITEKPFTKTKTWIVGDEDKISVSSVQKSESNFEKMPIPQPRKKWIEQDKPVSFDVPDLTINHVTNLDNQFVWKQGTVNEIGEQHKTRDNIPDIIASQMKYETRPGSSNSDGDHILEKDELYSQLDSVENEDKNFLLPGEVFHVVLDKKGGSLGLNIYQGSEPTCSEQRHIFIHSIIANGAADIDGRIKPGDKLLEVNGVLLENLSYQEVVTKLRESPQVAHLVLEKGRQIEMGTITTSHLNSKMDKKCISPSNEVTMKQLENVTKENENCTVKNKPSFSSLPTTDAELTSAFAKEKDSYLHSSKSNVPTSLDKFECENRKSVTSPNFAKECDANTPKNKPTTTSNKLVSYRSTPNLADYSDEESKNEGTSNIYRIRSTDCLASPFFTNPHPALFNIYRKFSFNRGTSNNLHSIPAVPIRKKKLKKLHDIYDYSNPDNTFKVSIHKSSRGLGLSICGGTGVAGRDAFSQLIRIRKLYPLQPALECRKLQLGDVILSVNGTNMVGLTNTEALEVLRTAPADVTLEIFRPAKSLIPSYSTFKDGMWPFCESSSSSASSSLSRTENSYNIETGEFEVTLIKRGGSLGFSITRKDSLPENSEEGIFVKALVREPAISDGRIQPGDKILQVNGVDVSNMSHAEAIEFIRKSPSSVTLKLLRTEPPLTPGYTEKDNQVNKPLRWEAVELLNDRMKNKDSSDEGSVPKRKIKRKLDRSFDAPSNSSTESSSTSSSSSSEQEHVLDENSDTKMTKDLNLESSGLQRNQRPKSLDVLNSSDRKRLPAYKDEESFHRQCSVMCSNVDSKTKNGSSNSESSAKKGFKNLLKWRGSTLPHSDDDTSPDVVPHATFSLSSTSNDHSQISQDSGSDDEKPVPFPRTTSCATEWVHTFDVDLDRGWHGRLGFSLCDPPVTTPNSPRNLLPNATEVKAVHPGSLADKDGRIKVGDRLVEANRECLLGKPASEVIDILRKTRGLIRMVFCRLEKRT